MSSVLPLLLVLLGCGPEEERRGPGGDEVFHFDGPVPSNLLVMSMDTTRKDQIGAHGGPGLTPFLDGIAAESLVVEDFVQCSNWTTASTACTQTGSANLDRELALGVGETMPAAPTLPVFLRSEGFYSALASGNGYFSKAQGSGSGFDDEVVLLGNQGLAVGRQGMDFVLDAKDVERFYLHLHFMEPHYVYDPQDVFLEDEPPLEPWPEDLRDIDVLRAIWSQGALEDPEEQALLEEHLWQLYRGEIRMMDHRMGRVWADLEAEGLLDDTLVVFWTDHGEQFWERGRHTHAYGLNAEENDAVLWFWAKNLEPGRIDRPVEARDVVPTLLELFDIKVPNRVTGLPLHAVEPGRPRFTAALGFTGPRQAVLLDEWKLSFDWSRAGVALYDRAADPSELRPLPIDHPKVEELWCLLEPEVARMEAVTGDTATPPAFLVGVCP